jgi:hypothetical protein
MLRLPRPQRRRRESDGLPVHDRRLDAAKRYADALGTAQEAYISFSQARAEALAPDFRGLHTGFGAVPIPPAPPLLELFKQQIEALEGYERERKVTASQSNEAA